MKLESLFPGMTDHERDMFWRAEIPALVAAVIVIGTATSVFFGRKTLTDALGFHVLVSLGLSMFVIVILALGLWSIKAFGAMVCFFYADKRSQDERVREKESSICGNDIEPK